MTVEQTESQKRMSQQARDSMSLARGGIQIFCAPLILRHGSVYDISGITGYSKYQIYEQTRFFRADGQLPPATVQSLHDIQVEAHKKKPKPDTDEYEVEQKRFAVARGLTKAGFIARETTKWHRLHALYQRHQRPLPDDFATKIRSEAFLVVHEQWRRGNQEPLGLFGRVLQEADPSLFQDLKLRAEHQFIMAAVAAEHGEVRQIGGPQVVTSIMIPAGGGVVEVVRNSIP